MPADVFIRSCAATGTRVRGTAVFLSSSPERIPSALLHNIKHNQVLHDRVIILTVQVEEVPHIPLSERIQLTGLGEGFYRVRLRHGFMDDVNVPAELARIEGCGPAFRMMETSFFLGRQTLIASSRPGMALWREKLFAWMMQNSESAMLFFKLPSNRVVELGSQVEI